MTTRPDLVNLPTLEIPTEGTTIFVVQDSAVNQTLTVEKARYLLSTIGPTGNTGPTGWTGPTGASGYSGYSGYSGVSGYSGYSGVSGYSGYSGVSGYSGISGYSGTSGYSGYSGTSGYSGYSGYSGTSGYSGYSGATGPTGPLVTTATDVWGGDTGSILIQANTNETAFIPLGNVGNLLQVKDSITATWISTSTLTVGYATNANNLYSNQYSDTEISPTKYVSLTQGANNYYSFGITDSISYHTNNKKLSVSNISVTSSTNSVNSSTGALTVEGGVGIKGDLHVGGGIFANQLTIEYTTVTMISVTTDDIVTINNTSSAVNTESGALVVLGGVGIGQDLYVGGLIYGNVNGVITTATNLADGTSGQIPYQINPGITGFFGPGTAGYVLVGNNTNSPVFQNTLTLTGNVLSVSTQSGTLIVQGGVGISGNLNVGENSTFTNNVTIQGDLEVNGGDLTSSASPFNLLNSTSAINFGSNSSGIVIGNNSGWTQIRSLVTLTNTTNATDINSGALTIKGGVGISKDLHVGGTIYGTIIGSISTATNLANGTVGQIPFQEGAGITKFFGPGNSGDILISSGASSSGPVFTNTSTFRVGYSDYTTNILGGTTGSIVYQNSLNQSVFLNIASTPGYVLTSNGTIPAWESVNNLTIDTATNALYIRTVSTDTNSTFYLTFVDTNNSTDNFEKLYTDAGISYNPSSNVLTLTGDLAVNGGNITSNQSSISIFNSTVETLNIGNASTAITIGNTSGYTNIRNLTTISNTTSATSTITGALQVRGGTGIGGDLYVGGDVYVLGQANYIINQANYANTATNLANGNSGSIPYQVSSGTTTFLSIGAEGQILSIDAAGEPVWKNPSTLSVTTATYAENLLGGNSGSIPYQNTTDDTVFLSIGSEGQILSIDAAGEPVWKNPSALSVTTATYAENLLGGNSGSIPYQTTTDDTVFLSIGSEGQILSINSSGIPVWKNPATLSVTTATYAENLTGGATGSIPYQNTADDTVFLSIGSEGQILSINSSGVPVWINTSSIVSGTAGLTNDLIGGTPGQIVYQRATNDTDFAGPGTTGQLLISRGASPNGPVFQSTATIQTLSVGTAWYGGADGEIRAANEITAYWGSDIRFKENIKPIDSALEIVNKIRGVKFDWKEDYLEKRGGEDGYFVRKQDIGVIAQEIESVLPEIVGTRDDGMKVVKYERLTALLIEAIKELSNEIKNLKK